MIDNADAMSPRFKARMAGVFQLLEAVTAAFGEVIVPGKWHGSPPAAWRRSRSARDHVR
jgi:hypothetical protein